MELFTIANENDYEIKSYNKVYLKKISYSEEECIKILNEAKNYFFTRKIESESTDFNDRYSSSTTYYEQINYSNLVVKDNKFNGVVANGLGRYDDFYMVCTLEKIEASWYDGSVYSYIEKTYKLRKYDFPEEALEFIHKYHIHLNLIAKKVVDDEEILDFENNVDYYLTAFDVILVDGVAVGLKYNDHEFRLDVPGSIENKYVEVKYYASKFNYYYTYTLEETK